MKLNIVALCGVPFSLMLACVCARADVKMPAIFSDHMVLERDKPIHVWGWASAGERVTVGLESQRVQTVAGVDGRWDVTLGKMSAEAAPQTLTVEGRNVVTFADVLIGELWLCSGQSNMERLLEQTIYSDTDLASAEDAQLRLFHVLPATAVTPQKDVQRWDSDGWLVSSSHRALEFSAVCFFFGRELRKHLGVPIGLVDSTKGGTRAQIWTSVKAIEKHSGADSDFNHWLREREEVVQHLAERTEAYPAQKRLYDEDLDGWTKETNADPSYTAAMKRWQAALDTAQHEGREWPAEPKPPLSKPVEPMLPDDGPYSRFMVGNLYNAMIAPLSEMTLRGILWYQGESNDKNAPQYKTIFPILIQDWRSQWHDSRLPFYFVQLPNIHQPQVNPVQDDDLWPWMREAQQSALALPNTAMAVTIDIGDPWNVHGKDKRDIGIRLSLLARKNIYRQSVVAQGPTLRSIRISGIRIKMRFANTGSGLALGVPPWTPTGVIPALATKLHGFAIAGKDRQWHWAIAVLRGNQVIASSPEVPNPVAVRYGWADNPPCNLYNREGLPAAPFRTDDWPSAPAQQ